MGWLVGAALTGASRAEMQKVYGWVGALLWQNPAPLHDPVLTLLFRIALLAAAAVAVPLMMLEAGMGRPWEAVLRAVIATAGSIASQPIAVWLTDLNRALLITISGVAGAHSLPSPPGAAGVIDFLVFAVPYFLLLVFLACLMLARMAIVVTLVAAAPVFWFLSLTGRLRHLPSFWFGQLAIWVLLPSAEAFLLVLARGLSGELGIPVPATDMLLGLVILVLMVRLPFTLLRHVGQWTGR